MCLNLVHFTLWNYFFPLSSIVVVSLSFFITNTPLKLEGEEVTPNLWTFDLWEGPDNDLVKTSASWEWEGSYEREMRPARNCCRTKWQLSSTCFVRSWKTGFFAIWIAAWLSECKVTGRDGVMERSANNHTNQVISATTRRIDLYSASADDRDTKDCFFDFHETGEPPKLI